MPKDDVTNVESNDVKISVCNDYAIAKPNDVTNANLVTSQLPSLMTSQKCET